MHILKLYLVRDGAGLCHIMHEIETRAHHRRVLIAEDFSYVVALPLDGVWIQLIESVQRHDSLLANYFVLVRQTLQNLTK